LQWLDFSAPEGIAYAMAQAQLKIFVAVVSLTILAGTVVGAYYAWEKVFKPELESKKGLTQALDNKAAPKSDPGKAVYADAMELTRSNELEGAKDKLKQLIKIYRDSEKYWDARRVLGEMNMDRLFSRSPMPGKLEFTVNREPGLDPIVNKSRTTIPFVRRINNLGSTVIHPGDRLILYPLDFEIEIRPNNKTLTLTQNGEFFKDYKITEIKLAPGVRLPGTTYIGSKQAFVGDKSVRDSDPRYSMARKWMQTATTPAKPGIIICAAPKKKGDEAPFGIYLEESDIEELCTVIRLKVPVKFIR
jgi:hypothetical protein